MKTNLPRLLLSAMLLTALHLHSARVLAQAPEVITYQGRVAASGTNFTGTGQFKFALVTVTNSATATATATINPIFGTLTIAVNYGGRGYVQAPSVVITGGGGSKATARAFISDGVVTSIAVMNQGSGYTSPPAVTVDPPASAYAYTTFWSNDGTSSAGGQPAAAVPVTVGDGLFTVRLGDSTVTNMATLPAGLFQEPNLHLRLWFSDGISTFAALEPTQPLTAAPYAFAAGSANNLLGTLSFSQLSGALPSAQLSGTYAGTVILNNAGNSLSGSGAGLTSLNAGQLTSGTVPDARLAVSVARTSQVWLLGGNAGTTPGTHFLGTTDNQALELRVNGTRALRLEPNATSPNIIGGYSGNSVGAGLSGGVVAGGGSSASPNRVTASHGAVGGGLGNTNGADAATISGGRDNAVQANSSYATIAGGTGNGIGTNARYAAIAGGSGNNIAADSWNATIAGGGGNAIGTNADYSAVGGGGGNQASGLYATVPGGRDNDAYGAYSFAAGRRARALGTGSFVWADSADLDFASGISSSNVFYVRASGGAKFFTGTNAFWTEADMSCATLTIRGGADLAEPFAVSGEAVQPGAVVVIDPDQPGRLKLSTSAYDHKVAGIVSGAGGVQPGISMVQTDKLEGGRNVALSGRVFALVDATKNPVRPGDLLTTSDTPGHAMKAANPALAQGSILGKAMTPLAGGRGLVLVLVSLQ